jgi:hypothetical protein
MKIIIRLMLLAVLGGLAFWLWTVLFPSPEQVVLKKIATLAANANIAAADSNLNRAGKAARLVAAFANDAEIVMEVAGVGTKTWSGHDEIQEAAMGGFATVTALKVQFLDLTARVGPDKKTADVSCTAHVNTGDSRDIGIQELHFELKKIDGDWLITRAETVKTLQ